MVTYLIGYVLNCVSAVNTANIYTFIITNVVGTYTAGQNVIMISKIKIKISHD